MAPISTSQGSQLHAQIAEEFSIQWVMTSKLPARVIIASGGRWKLSSTMVSRSTPLGVVQASALERWRMSRSSFAALSPSPANAAC